ncbi:MAG TPA: PIG-L family deacetylase [bacterium]|nr:PIG-L family deacetylase [bacterium]
MSYEYYDLDRRRKSPNLDLIFPGFRPEQETVAVISPHDDDALLGAGYLVQAVLAAGARVRIMIVCDGSAGYSRIEHKPGIVERRKEEARAAYRSLGILPGDLAWLGLPDFSAIHYLGWRLPGGGEGLFARAVPLLREWRATRLVIPNGHREHIDHTAAHLAGMFFGPQAGDAVLADWGPAAAITTTLIYSVWADLPPRPGPGLRANRAIMAPATAERAVMEALNMFRSQAEVIAGLVKAREGRLRGARALELFREVDPRPRLDYAPYWDAVGKIG